MKYVSFKVFVKSMNKDDIINDWLNKNPDIDVVKILQTQDSEFINISIFYEK